LEISRRVGKLDLVHGEFAVLVHIPLFVKCPLGHHHAVTHTDSAADFDPAIIQIRSLNVNLSNHGAAVKLSHLNVGKILNVVGRWRHDDDYDVVVAVGAGWKSWPKKIMKRVGIIVLPRFFVGHCQNYSRKILLYGEREVPNASGGRWAPGVKAWLRILP